MGWLRKNGHGQGLDSPWRLSLLLLVPTTGIILLLNASVLFKAPLTSNHNVARLALVRRGYLQEPAQDVNTSSLLLRRDDYTCGPGRPCRNGACCGESGFCGYGNTYCGPGCTSNCDAHAECGKDSVKPGTECPLNTCCSQYGFCGTTEEFCGTGCQSNCVLHPKPPGGGAAVGILENRVIGYYESWSARKDCHKIGPTELALDALTHVNFAFASIEPGSYKVVPMDSQTPESLFRDVPNLKTIKPSLKVFISIGGWTFSDNGTVTQPLFGEIARDAAKRKTFANNVVSFMREYGYDGVDIDWEYPGAGDRGGKPDDVDNYVLLMKEFRQTFDASGSRFGLTFTAPSSFWYLRWFDLPGLVKWVDWINLMTYDLHGVWDRDNPIGSIVQGHTNLTEIKLAAELFWRVGISPAKIAMGFGFYGRSFTLANPSCTKPGCPFSGASDKGPCTGEGGILGHYEIQAIIKNKNGGSRKRAITPIHDKEAAVKYFTFDNDQWVSYDDKDTLKQKVQWANEVGLGGALIWASDLDDDKYTAHADLLGRSVQSTAQLASSEKALSDSVSLVEDLRGSNGEKCFAYTNKCVNLNDNKAMSEACGSGFTPVGWDDAGCGKKSCHCGKPICCPTNTAPKDCKWRGDDTGGVGGDCSAQCNAGEVNIKGIQSSWGGGFVNDGNTNKCRRGKKAFCCPSSDYNAVTKGCTFTSCLSSCPSDKDPVYSKNDACFVGTQYYCCPKPVQLKSCRWESGSKGTDCVNAICKDTELEVDRAQYGEWATTGCSWGRTKAACCTVERAPPKPAFCTSDVCKTIPEFCTEPPISSKRRDLETRMPASRDDNVNVSITSREMSILDKRGNAEPYYVSLGPVGITIIAMAYPGLVEIFGLQGASRVLRRMIRMIAGYCVGPAIEELVIGPGDHPGHMEGLEAEHPIDRQVVINFAKAASSGTLASGQNANIQPIAPQWWKDNWHREVPALGRRPAIGSAQGMSWETPNDRVMECFGSYDYPDPFIPTDKRINGAKNYLMRLRQPATADRVRRLAQDAVRTDSQQALDDLLSPIRAGIAVFEYLNRPDVTQRFNMVRRQVRQQLQYIEADVPGAQGIAQWWDVFTQDYFDLVGERARAWARDVILAAAGPFEQALQAGVPLNILNQAIGALEQMLDEINTMYVPGDNSIPNYPPPGGGGGTVKLARFEGLGG